MRDDYEEETVEEHEEETTVEVLRAHDPPAGELPEDILGLLEMLGDNTPTVDVFRKNPRTRQQEFVDNISVDEFLSAGLELIKERYGGGIYMFRPKDLEGKYTRQTTRTATIAGRPRDPTEEDRRESSPQTEAITRVLGEVRDELRARASTTGDPLALGIQLAKQIQEAMAPLQAELLKLATRHEEPAADPLELVDRVLELTDRLRGSASPGGSVVNQLGHELITLFRDNRSRGPVPGPEAPTATPGAGAPPVPTDPSIPRWVGFVQPYVPSLMQLAALRRDPSAYAVVVLDQMGPAGSAFLADLLRETPDFPERFYARFPDTGQHKYWFDQLFSELRAMLVDEEPEEPEDATIEVVGGDDAGE